jgi:hypothetical protein
MNTKIHIRQPFGEKQLFIIVFPVIMLGFILFFLNQYRRSTYYSFEIEKVLQQAGNNRNELETVLTHYGRNTGDSLKLRAAEFLIVNMPGKYSSVYEAPWEDVATVCLRWTSSSN